MPLLSAALYISLVKNSLNFIPQLLAYQGSMDTPKSANEREQMFRKLNEIVLDGLKHGFFEYTVTCELTNNHKRRLVIKAGKSHQFFIPEEDLEN